MHYKTFKTSYNEFFVYESNKNSVYKITETDFNSLTSIERGIYSGNDMDVLKKFNNNGLIKPMNIKKVEHNNSEILPYHFQKGINNIILQITQQCNLICSYCPFGNGNKFYRSYRIHEKKDMTKEIIDKSINLLETNSLVEVKKYISFYGGEPLLRKDLIMYTIEKAVSRFGKDMVHFGMTTNATLLTIEFIETIKDINLDILVSLDGPKEIHNQNRKFVNKTGSYDIIHKNLSEIKLKYPRIYERIRFNVVISPQTDYEKIFQFIRNKESHLTLENTTLNTVSNNYIKNEVNYDRKFFEEANYDMYRTLLFLLNKVDDEILIHKSNIDKIYMFAKFLKPIRETETISHPTGTCIPGLKKLFINVSGDFFPCEKANENSKIQNIGNIENGFDFEKVKNLMNIGKVTSKTCKECWAFHLCSVCPIVADDGYSNYYRSEYKLKKCKAIKQEIINNLRIYCVLKENGIKF